jgi:hypothetical protein
LGDNGAAPLTAEQWEAEFYNDAPPSRRDQADRDEYIPPEHEAQEAQPEPPASKPLTDLKRREVNDPTELLRTGYLCQGGGLLLCGPTGIGKSSLAMQAMILWGLGRACFGIAPVKPLKSLLIQAENDDGDTAEMRDGVTTGLELPSTQIQSALANITVACEDTRTAEAFTALTLAPLLEKHRPDLVWIDPALAYLGGEANSQKDVGGFLRNLVNPLLHRFECGGIIITHTNKPPTGHEKPNWQAGDFAYLGTGSAEWANWARAVLALRSIGSHEVFELVAGKRGRRLGWKDAANNPAYSKFLAHSKEPGVICWREVEPGEVETGGRPKGKSYDPDELLALLPPKGLPMVKWVKLAKSELNVSEATLHRERREFLKAGRIIKSSTSGKWQPVTKA